MDLYIRKFKKYPKTYALLKEFGWSSSKQLLDFVQSLNEKKFENSALFKKEAYYDILVKQLDECEEYGNTLEDLRETMGDMIKYYYSNDYGHLMSGYKKERKKLRNLLSVLNIISDRKIIRNKSSRK